MYVIARRKQTYLAYGINQLHIFLLYVLYTSGCVLQKGVHQQHYILYKQSNKNG